MEIGVVEILSQYYLMEKTLIIKLFQFMHTRELREGKVHRKQSSNDTFILLNKSDFHSATLLY